MVEVALGAEGDTGREVLSSAAELELLAEAEPEIVIGTGDEVIQARLRREFEATLDLVDAAIIAHGKSGCSYIDQRISEGLDRVKLLG
jgi:hypothetical protein